MALIDKASLLMVPSTYEDGTLYNVLPSGNRAPDNKGGAGYDQTRADFTFDRGNNLAATRIDENGLIEKGRENLLLQSNSFDTTWTESGSSGIISSGQSGYDGSSDAWQLEHKGNQYTSLRQTISTSGVQTYSVYAKAGTLDYIVLYAGAPRAWFDVKNGAVGFTSTVIDTNIEAVSGAEGWYRCSMVFNAGATTARIYPNDASGTFGTATGTVFIQDSQLEKGLIATDVMTSGSTTAKAGVLEDMPRISYDANGENGALLLEGLRSNLITNSEYFGAWSKATGGTGSNPVLDFGYTSPEGIDNAYKVTFDKGAGTTTSDLSVLQTSFTSASNTASFYVKADAATRLMVRNSGTWAIYDITTEWTRIEKTDTGGSLQIGLREGYGLSDVPDSCSVYLYGAQVESGASYASSYIPTHGAAVSRSADRPQILNTTTDVLSQTAFTLFFEADLTSDTANNFRDIVAFRGASKELRFETRTDNSVRVQSNMITSGDSFNSATIGDTDNKKFAMTFTTSQVRLYADGSLVSTYNGAYSSDLVHILFMNSTSLGVETKTNFKQYILFSEALTDAECVTLTTL